ncbi:hypothetical protein COCCADRAFT_113610, partial [Bipolaris zeicola 26-R-13]
IPNDGPTGTLSGVSAWHPYSPSRSHFMFNKPEYDRLIMWFRHCVRLLGVTLGTLTLVFSWLQIYAAAYVRGQTFF